MTFRLLAGPLLRRAKPGSIATLLGSHNSAAVRIEVGFDEPDPKRATKRAQIRALPGVTNKPPREFAFSSELLVTLCEASLPPQDGHRPGRRHFYRIRSTVPQIDDVLARRQRDLSLFDDGWLRLPSDGADAPTSTFACSCRNLSSDAKDAVSGLWKRLAEAFEFPANCSLLMLGDQIYADETGRLLPTVEGLARELFPKYRPTAKRMEAARQAGLTTEMPGEQLLAVAEFAAAYLIHFSTLCWPNDRRSDLGPRRAETAVWERVLAQVPVLSLIDDHELSDDWFIDAKWRKRLLASDEGREILAAGLLSFAIFQAWGTDATIASDRLEMWQKTLERGGRAAELLPDLITKGWSTVSTSSGPYVLLDTRTGRHESDTCRLVRIIDLDGAVRTSRPSLRQEWIGRAELKSYLEVFKQGRACLALQTPLFGMPVFEWVLSLLPTSLSNFIDAESWAYSPLSWTMLAEELGKLGLKDRILLLAGDVHYSFLAEGEFLVDNSVIRCLQVTTSPICNNASPQAPFGAGAGEGIWHIECTWWGKNGILDYLERVQESTSTLRAIEKLRRDKAGRFIARRWRIVANNAGAIPRPLYVPCFSEVTSTPGNRYVSVRNREGEALLEARV